MIYTVDEVSVELGIPRPTVYRYLKEYSIPFSRRSGRIFVPEESIRKVGTVRELHAGGFGTEAIREKLKQGKARISNASPNGSTSWRTPWRARGWNAGRR
ncbi:helix-turn-helix domain-containing protein [Rubrobacter marinus]|uniref:Helix-turn-helix domain-containing protein n=1 Tax=Rubrobacter marinus TaxID=2653852 RepID=A0A6G8PXR5_9ACTN|nr:helix-turn-helix domain-containing protein [Rubrobacter marinus]QIN79009.1 helix-turn-helix domain-containing protein [Rubrobacter marinus]